MHELLDPGAGLPVPLLLAAAFLLGVLHGITPDEHTWPITFSYAIGGFSTRRGMLSGFLFSLAFTLQRAIAAELAALALVGFLSLPHFEEALYVVVGLLMVLAGRYLHRHGHALHLFHHEVGEEPLETGRPVPAKLALLHGFVAGWGTGAFATVIYAALAPAMPSVYLGWVPGLMFGLGTMVTMVLFGAAVGAWMQSRHMGVDAMAFVGRRVSSTTLFWGGWVFVLAGIVGLLVPLNDLVITTPVRWYSLHHLSIGFLLMVGALFVIAVGAFWDATRTARLRFR